MSIAGVLNNKLGALSNDKVKLLEYSRSAVILIIPVLYKEREKFSRAVKKGCVPSLLLTVSDSNDLTMILSGTIFLVLDA